MIVKLGWLILLICFKNNTKDVANKWMLRWTGQTKPPFVKVVALNLPHPRRPIFAAGVGKKGFSFKYHSRKSSLWNFKSDLRIVFHYWIICVSVYCHVIMSLDYLFFNIITFCNTVSIYSHVIKVIVVVVLSLPAHLLPSNIQCRVEWLVFSLNTASKELKVA